MRRGFRRWRSGKRPHGSRRPHPPEWRCWPSCRNGWSRLSPTLRPRAETSAREHATETQCGQRVSGWRVARREWWKSLQRGVLSSATPNAIRSVTRGEQFSGESGRCRAWSKTPGRPPPHRAGTALAGRMTAEIASDDKHVRFAPLVVPMATHRPGVRRCSAFPSLLSRVRLAVPGGALRGSHPGL